MARYIDAEFVSDGLRKVLHSPKSEFPDDFEQAINCLVYAISILKFAPTADVVPVVHAHWIEKEDCSVITDIPWSMCSACGEYSPKLLYCAFCGAKMDEEQ